MLPRDTSCTTSTRRHYCTCRMDMSSTRSNPMTTNRSLLSSSSSKTCPSFLGICPLGSTCSLRWCMRTSSKKCTFHSDRSSSYRNMDSSHSNSRLKKGSSSSWENSSWERSSSNSSKTTRAFYGFVRHHLVHHVYC